MNDQLLQLIRSLLPPTVSEEELRRRFGALYDPAYQQEETDLGDEFGRQTSRFQEDRGISGQRLGQTRDITLGRLNRSRALEQAQTAESLAASGASGGLAEAYMARRLQPIDDQSTDATRGFDEQQQDTERQATRFLDDAERDRKKRLTSIKQRRSTALAGYLSDPNNRYEFSY